MTRFTLLLAVVMSCFAVVAVSAAPNLYINGTLTEPVLLDSYGWYDASANFDLTFTLLYEETPYYNNNIFCIHQDWSSPVASDIVFSGSDGVGTVKTMHFTSEFIAQSLLNDINGNGLFDVGNGESWVNSNKGQNRPNPPGSDYQFLRPYEYDGYAHYYYEEGALDFWGDFDALLFIDDGPVTGGSDLDHNDMVVGFNKVVTPEPSTLILLLFGMTGIFAVRYLRN
jgi:hypothetical protein